MKSLTFFAVALFFLAFGGVYFYNANQLQNSNLVFKFQPLYAFAPGDVLSVFNAFFFVFIVSLLLFGLGGVVSMAHEGAKYGYLLSTISRPSGFHVFDLFFIVPQLMACIAATTLGAGLILDYRGKSSLFPYWNYALRYFGLGLFITIVLIGIRPFLV